MKQSAGLLVYRKNKGSVEVLLAHMGSPWWAKKDIGAWSIPKGEIEENEDALETAKREFTEELGLQVPAGELIELGSVKQHNNKSVQAWAVEADMDASSIKSNTFKTQWPPRSGKIQEFPEVDRAEWFTLAEAAQKAVRGQAGLFEKLAEVLNVPFDTGKAPEPPEQGSLF